MSKRSGEFVTLRDLYEEVGVDAARYFFLMRKGASPLDFDVDLAKRQTDENPVFYVQMAHARLSGIFRTAERAPDDVTGAARPRGLAGAAGRRAAQEAGHVPRGRGRRPRASASRTGSPCTSTSSRPWCTRWYHHTRAVGAPEGPATEQARLLLARAARIVLANALALLGISAPDRM